MAKIIALAKAISLLLLFGLAVLYILYAPNYVSQLEYQG